MFNASNHVCIKHTTDNGTGWNFADLFKIRRLFRKLDFLKKQLLDLFLLLIDFKTNYSFRIQNIILREMPPLKSANAPKSKKGTAVVKMYENLKNSSRLHQLAGIEHLFAGF